MDIEDPAYIELFLDYENGKGLRALQGREIAQNGVSFKLYDVQFDAQLSARKPPPDPKEGLHTFPQLKRWVSSFLSRVRLACLPQCAT